MAQPNEFMSNGGVEQYGRGGEFGSFRTFTDGLVPARPRVRSLPKDPPTHFHAGIKDADIVHIIGTAQEDQARAITYALYPEVKARQTVWTADLTGHRVTEDLAMHAYRAGVGTLHWPDVSPTRLIESHREVDVAQAARLVVDSMPAGAKADPELTQARIIHLTRIFEKLDEGTRPDEERLPLLGGGYNAIGIAIQSDQRSTKFMIDDRNKADAMRKMYSTPNAQSTAQEILGPVHVHMEALLRGGNMSKPVRANPGAPTTLFNLSVRDSGMFVASRRRLLASHVDLRCSEDDGVERRDPEDVRPQRTLMAGVEQTDPDPLIHIQQKNEEHDATTYLVFGGVTDTTVEVIGTDRAVTVALGGLNGPDAEKVSDAVGKHWQKAVTSRGRHIGRSDALQNGRTNQENEDETTTFESRHTLPTSAVQHVDEGAATLVQGTIVHKNIPFVPHEVVKAIDHQDARPTGRAKRPPVRALPTTETWRSRTAKKLGW